jgi:hypothetical protein
VNCREFAQGISPLEDAEFQARVRGSLEGEEAELAEALRRFSEYFRQLVSRTASNFESAGERGGRACKTSIASSKPRPVASKPPFAVQTTALLGAKHPDFATMR